MKISTNKYDSKPILTKDTINELQTSVKTYVENAISSLKLVDSSNPYLYEIEYDWIDYDYAINQFNTRWNTDYIKAMQCTSGRFGNFHARNLDWYYDNEVDFIVRTKAHDGLYASISTCTAIPQLTNEVVASRAYSDKYKMLPFYVTDGINEHGVVVNGNVVPKDFPVKTNLHDEGKERMCNLMLNRWILDHCKSAKEAAEAIRDKFNIWFPPNEIVAYESHYMVSDIAETYVIEFINGVTKIINMTTELPNRQIMTNFHLLKRNEQGEVSLIGLDTSTSIKWQDITPHGDGVERYNLLLDKIIKGKTTTLNDIKTVFREDLMYSKSYRDWDNLPEKFWYTEYVDTDPSTDLTVEKAFTPSLRNLYEKSVRKSWNDFNNRKRTEHITWITTHTAIYDIEKKKMYLTSQEDNTKEYVYRVKETYTADEIDALLDEIRNY